MKIYIVGKITGDKKCRAKFREAAKTLEALGHVVLNPAVLPAGLTKQDYMQITLAMLEAWIWPCFCRTTRKARAL